MRILQQSRYWLRLGASLTLLAILAGLGWAAVRHLRYRLALHAVDQTQSTRRALAYLRRARGLRPDLSESWRLEADWQSLIHPRRAQALAARAIAINPYNWRNWHRLAMIDLQLGDMTGAKNAMQRAARFDRGFLAHFQMANLSWLIGDRATFWREMKTALRIAPVPDMVPALNNTIALVGYRTRKLVSLVPAGDTPLGADMIQMLGAAGHFRAAAQVWSSLACPAYQANLCNSAAMSLVSGLLAYARSSPSSRRPFLAPQNPGRWPRPAAIALAMAIWNQAIQRRVLNAAPVRWGRVTDGNFLHPWLGQWTWQARSWPLQLLLGPDLHNNSVSIRLSGAQPSRLRFLREYLPVKPGKYNISYEGRGSGLYSGSGIELQVFTQSSVSLLRVSAQLSAKWRSYSGDFTIRHNELLTVAVGYRRPFGVPLMKGQIYIRNINLHVYRPGMTGLMTGNIHRNL